MATKIENDPRNKPVNIRFPPTRVHKRLNNTPSPDNTSNLTQSSKISGKSGYCYIGEDRGFRSCVKVNEDDTCMSGEIFSNQAQCIYPHFRV